MKEKALSFIESIKALWSKTSKKMRVAVLSVAAGILAVSLIAVILLNRSDYVALYDDLSTTESAEVLAQLQEMGVEGRLEGNRLLVPQKDENMVRMQLAARGYQNAGFDYTTFERGTGLTSTQSVQRQWAINDLQDRLQATIKTFPEVTEAIVTISMPETSNFVLESDIIEPSASVKLQVRPGRDLSTDQIQGIMNIVKNSVPGLREENISIADQSGDLLGTLALGKDASATKFQLMEQVNESVKRRILTMIGPLYGEGKVNVAVNSVLDTDQKVTEENTYIPLDPENPTNNPLDYYEADREKQGGTGGLASGVPGANDNTEVPEYLGYQAEMDDSDYYRNHEVYDYLVSSVKSQIIKEGLEITDMTVAVLIDADALPAGQRDQVIDLVATTAGVSRDKVSVQSIAFSPVVIEGEGGILSPSNNLLIPIIIAIAAAVLIFVMVIVFLLQRRKQKQQAAEEAQLAEDGTLVDLMGVDEEFEPIIIPETSEQKLKAQIRDLANSDPEIVAQLIKTWLIET